MASVRNLDSVSWESGPDRKLAHNTYRVTVVSFDTDGIRRERPGVRYHGTVIISADHDPVLGMGYVLNSGGWHTSTTKQRLSALLPGGMGVYQKNHEWFVSTSDGDIPFEDGMRVTY